MFGEDSLDSCWRRKTWDIFSTAVTSITAPWACKLDAFIPVGIFLALETRGRKLGFPFRLELQSRPDALNWRGFNQSLNLSRDEFFFLSLSSWSCYWSTQHLHLGFFFKVTCSTCDASPGPWAVTLPTSTVAFVAEPTWNQKINFSASQSTIQFKVRPCPKLTREQFF